MRRQWATIWIQIFVFLNATTVAGATVTSADCEIHLLRHGYQFVPMNRPALYGARGGPLLMTTQGETFLVLAQAGYTALYNLEKNDLKTFEVGQFEETADIFESRNGLIYLAYITNTHLKVFDARTAKNLITTRLADIPIVENLFAQIAPATPLFRPLFLQSNHGVRVAILPRSDELYLDESFVLPLVTLNIRTGARQTDELHSGIFRFERMQNGHVYGMGWERAMGGYPNTLLVHDLNSRRTLLREKFEHRQDPPIIAGQLSLFFEDPQNPALVMILPRPNGQVMRYDKSDRQFSPLPGLSRAATEGIQFFNDESGKPWFAAIEGNERTSLIADHYRLVIQPMTGLNGAFVQDLALESPENDVSGLEVIERSEGRLFLAWERTVINGKSRYARVHIYDQTTKEMVTVSIPREWPGSTHRKSFWDPVKKVLYTYFVRDEGMSPEIAQIYGPVTN